MECPHCKIHFHPDFATTQLGNGAIGVDGPGGGTPLFFEARHGRCPACRQPLVLVGWGYKVGHWFKSAWAYPKSRSRSAAPPEVPASIGEDFNEAGAVLDYSPKASAALSRRALQAVLRERGYAQHDLARQIDAVLESKVLPSDLADNVDAIRNIGNFAAHPMKDTSSGEILPVEPHEAEWNLEVLESLFDHFYVAPARAKAKRAALDDKLAAAGKPPMKS